MYNGGVDDPFEVMLRQRKRRRNRFAYGLPVLGLLIVLATIMPPQSVIDVGQHLGVFIPLLGVGTALLFAGIIIDAVGTTRDRTLRAAHRDAQKKESNG